MCALSTNCQVVLCGTHSAQLKWELCVNVKKPKHYISSLFNKQVFINIYPRSLPKRNQSEFSRLNYCHTNCKYLLLNLTRVCLLPNAHHNLSANPGVTAVHFVCLPSTLTTSVCDTSMVHNVGFHLVKET